MVVVNNILSRHVIAVGKDLESTAVASDAWHHLSDANTSGFDFIGIYFARSTRNAAVDDWAAICA